MAPYPRAKCSLYVLVSRPPLRKYRGLTSNAERVNRREDSMKVVTLKDIPDLPVEGADRIEGWTGPVSRSRQTIIEPGDSPNYNCSVVNFSQGCTTGWHAHDCDQILVVTSGSG